MTEKLVWKELINQNSIKKFRSLLQIISTLVEKTKKAVCGRLGALGSFFLFLPFFAALDPGGGT